MHLYSCPRFMVCWTASLMLIVIPHCRYSQDDEHHVQTWVFFSRNIDCHRHAEHWTWQSCSVKHSTRTDTANYNNSLILPGVNPTFKGICSVVKFGILVPRFVHGLWFVCLNARSIRRHTLVLIGQLNLNKMLKPGLY